MYEKFIIEDSSLIFYKKKTSFVVNRGIQLNSFVEKLKDSIVIMNAFSDLEHLVKSHSHYQENGGTFQGKVFAIDGTPLDLGENVFFSLYSKESIKKYLIDKTVCMKLKERIMKKLDIEDNYFLKKTMGELSNTEKILVSNLEAGEDDVFMRTFLPYYSTPDNFWAYLSEEDDKVLSFLHELVLYNLCFSYEERIQQELHTDTIKQMCRREFEIDVLDEESVFEIQSVISISLQDDFFYEFIENKRYRALFFLVYLIEFYKNVLSNFLVKNSLVSDNYFEGSIFFPNTTLY